MMKNVNVCLCFLKTIWRAKYWLLLWIVWQLIVEVFSYRYFVTFNDSIFWEDNDTNGGYDDLLKREVNFHFPSDRDIII